MSKTKTHKIPLDDDLAKQLLNSSGVSVDGQFLGDALHNAAETLSLLAERATEYLESSEFAEIVAENLAKKTKRRGVAKIGVSNNGRLVLTISYDEDIRAQANTKLIPKMKDLRTMAEKLGVDITSFGIKRRAIYEHLKKAEEGTAPSFASKANQKPPSDPTSLKIKSSVDDKEDGDNGPMSAGPDETRVTPLPEDPPPPPKKGRGFVKVSEALSSPVVVPLSDVRSSFGDTEAKKPSKLQQLVEKSKEIDINDLLSAEAPE